MPVAAIAATMMLAAPAAVPLAPTGQWLVEGQDNMCALLHDYGEGKSAVTLGFRPWPMEDAMDVLLFSSSEALWVREGKAAIRFEPSGETTESTYVSFALANREKRLASFMIPRAALTTFGSSTAVTVTLDGKKAITVVPPVTKSALAALANCETLLFKSLGIDPTSRDRIQTEPEPIGSTQQWVRPKDYPREALQGGVAGKTMTMLTIGIDGRVTKCVSFGVSGNAAMDKAACAAILLRARLKPAIGKDGKPMVSYVDLAVHWINR